MGIHISCSDCFVQLVLWQWQFAHCEQSPLAQRPIKIVIVLVVVVVAVAVAAAVGSWCVCRRGGWNGFRVEMCSNLIFGTWPSGQRICAVHCVSVFVVAERNVRFQGCVVPILDVSHMTVWTSLGNSASCRGGDGIVLCRVTSCSFLRTM